MKASRLNILKKNAIHTLLIAIGIFVATYYLSKIILNFKLIDIIGALSIIYIFGYFIYFLILNLIKLIREFKSIRNNPS
jgi:hypothetical protein